MTFRKILCPTDFSAGSQQALRVAARLANESKSELVIAHSWHVPDIAFAEFTFPGDLIRELAEDAQRGLAAVVQEAKSFGVERVTSTLTQGWPWKDLVDIVEKDDAFDLIVIGTHGRTGLRRVMLGSVAEKVIRHASCSVLAVRPDTGLKPFVHALCPTDFSASANAAVELASKVVPANGSITLLHVLELPVAVSGEMTVMGLERELDSEATKALEESARRLRGSGSFNVAIRARLGYAGAQVLAVVDEDRSIDLIVMGSHGRTGISRAVLGSVAEKVTRHSRCPVLIARTR
jgi:nucleotide-binding universal stress UspA family protein